LRILEVVCLIFNNISCYFNFSPIGPLFAEKTYKKERNKVSEGKKIFLKVASLLILVMLDYKILEWFNRQITKKVK
jgi:hypothetical protein